MSGDALGAYGRERWRAAQKNSEARIGAAIIRGRAAWGLEVGRAWYEGCTAGMVSVGEAVERIVEAFAEQRRIAEDAARWHNALAFRIQRDTVEGLLAAPWYRHLRLRWSLRRARRWSE